MTEKKILFISSELIPYSPENEVSSMSYEAPRIVNEKGGKIRIFMPKFGNINERRHQLHEVIRLSGMNLVINDMDMPLIIKVASIPKEKIQVYFIDNEEYFKRKAVFTDKEGNLFSDNDERAIFFAKGVVETVKKLNWTPDIVHIHGWMTSLVPLYLKSYYADEALFADSKIVTSVYGKGFDGTLNKNLKEKIKFDKIEHQDLDILAHPSYNNLLKVAINHSDAIILGSEAVSEELKTHIENAEKPVLDYVQRHHFEEAYEQFFNEEVLR